MHTDVYLMVVYREMVRNRSLPEQDLKESLIMKTLIIRCLIALGFIFSVYSLNVQAVMAHGEKALEPFIRMRTIQFYDVQWDKQKFNVNEEVSVNGKFHVAEDWPISVPKPEASFLNISTPGPVLIRTERYLNGKPFMNSVALQPGGAGGGVPAYPAPDPRARSARP